ncbi:MAG TPA: PAS domain S-box protein, partial [candidate division Zixibacteria bacterium]|nr:PAS domain S-box protein [candidate division Zixibacteria bacterium]
MRIIWANRAACEAAGVDGPLAGRFCPEVWGHPDHECQQCPAARAMESGVAEEGEVTAEDGTIWWIRGYPVFADDGTIIGATRFATDITARKRSEQRITDSERRFRELAELAPEGIVEVAPSGRITFANRKAGEYSGYTQSELLSRITPLDLVAPEDRARASRAIVRTLAGDTTEAREYTALRKDGTRFPVRVHSAPILRDGKPAGIRVIISDMTEQRKAQAALAEQEALMRATLESTADGILVVDDIGRTVYTNARFAELWRIPDDLLELEDDDKLLAFVLDQLQDPDAFLAKVKALYQSPEEAFDTLLFKDGRVFERYSRPLIRKGSLTGRLWSFRDITEQRRQHAELMR